MGSDRPHPRAGEAARPVAIDLASGTTRAEVLRRAVGCGAVVLLGGGGVAILAPGTGTAQYSGTDVEILNFALGLERLQAAFYARAVDEAAIDGDPLEFARVAAEHEAAHVEALVALLGAKRRRRARARLRRRDVQPRGLPRRRRSRSRTSASTPTTARRRTSAPGPWRPPRRHRVRRRPPRRLDPVTGRRGPAAKPVDAGRPAARSRPPSRRRASWCSRERRARIDLRADRPVRARSRTAADRAGLTRAAPSSAAAALAAAGALGVTAAAPLTAQGGTSDTAILDFALLAGGTCRPPSTPRPSAARPSARGR